MRTTVHAVGLKELSTLDSFKSSKSFITSRLV